MQYFLLFLFLLISVFLEAVWTTLPLTLCLLLVISIFKKDHKVFILAFLAGLLLDLSLVRSLGFSSIFFTLFLFIVFLYENKFEAETIPFVFFASFLGVFTYSLLVGYDDILLQSLVAAFFASLAFLGIKQLRLFPS